MERRQFLAASLATSAMTITGSASAQAEPTREFYQVRRYSLQTGPQQKLTESYVVSNTKIKHALHVDHLPISARQGLSTTIQSFFRNN